VSSATAGQPATAAASTTWNFDVEPLIGQFWDVTLDVFAEAGNVRPGMSTAASHGRRC
jgi:hypothetical protein